ncbi:MAG: hypothetical protein CMB32_07115 [Euryarchaeota archaeon]|nr:hypothetical protein [Euryarchaeota archaeon]|tara:strand:- start:1869 stop:3200 length:1332 start_codon:yes stop_codon:yes gene_type:complete
MINSVLKFLKNLNPDFVKLLTGSGMVFFFRVLGGLAGYAVTYLITTSYGAETFGLFEMCLTILTIIGVLGRMGFDGALVKFIPQFREQGEFSHLRDTYKFTLSRAIPLSILMGIGLFIGADFIASFFNSNHLAEGIRITAFIVPFSTWIGLNSEAFRGMKNMVAYSIYQRGTTIFIACFAILILKSLYPSWIHVPLVGFGIGAVMLSVVAGIDAPKRIYELGEAQTSSTPFLSSTILAVAFPMLLHASMFMVMNWTDTLMIEYFYEETEVGIYRLAFKVAALITVAQYAINSIAAPMFSSFKTKGDINGLRKIVRNIGYLNLLISVPIFIVIQLFPSFILEFFGEEFTGGTAPLIVLSIGSILNALCGPVMYLLSMTGFEKTARNIIVIASAFNIAMNLFLIPKFGILGAAYATSICTVLWNVMAVIKIKKEYGFVSIPHPFN